MKDTEFIWFRDLFEEVVEYDGENLFYDRLVTWIERAKPAIAELSQFRQLSAYDFRNESDQLRMWNLYALSRVNDWLLCSFQSKNGSFPARVVSLEEYIAFFAGLGFTVVEKDRYSPFYHEIVRVHPSNDHKEPIRLVDKHWPTLMFGDMLFSRSGVDVIGGRENVVKEIAEKSVIYFTYLRLTRKTCDESVGWGHNSQWRTDFRRDYECNGTWFYNVDGRNSLNDPNHSKLDQHDGLTLEQRIELCKNRCFVVSSVNDDDLYPFNERFEEAMIL